ncbi:hypothetical protein A3H22_01995 [Candidatus Peribacteria bacterium RIFCSPLOWO2_12_FULL_55_15]|nr:MAG: hypothetical protein A2789_03095 [Candidatus Peribacteria bacterium RIFCSPHIGHO2_01_FULL_54_22]OGJ62414.1 MAG: hypothetical protein A3D12_01330 [Candidatus Peribacteria bacterium RIFCSPHIGHO2_02_FULL_55_24]OGJ63991.1 MAG: hypothetical protein A3E47_02700 [Candidatus Peribacteria bacterium RIFCSPHIGHO2_12_FULL_54_10]OGJ68799.1 MAG: hypothetical protein A2947_03040 [Candidatus Peribacteria bacterium RIFCSPLOWO2_01_FULL_54_110]OGJ69319.1 MAG: hypothetical protein A3H90_00720 [Candidatus Pe
MGENIGKESIMKTWIGIGTILLSCTLGGTLQSETITAGIEIVQKVLPDDEIDTTMNIKVTAREHLNWVTFRYCRHPKDEKRGTITVSIGCSGAGLSSLVLYQPKSLTINGIIVLPSKVAKDRKSFEEEESSVTRYRYSLKEGKPLEPIEERLEGKIIRTKGGPFIFHQDGPHRRVWECIPLHKETDSP